MKLVSRLIAAALALGISAGARADEKQEERLQQAAAAARKADVELLCTYAEQHPTRKYKNERGQEVAVWETPGQRLECSPTYAILRDYGPTSIWLWYDHGRDGMLDVHIYLNSDSLLDEERRFGRDMTKHDRSAPDLSLTAFEQQQLDNYGLGDLDEMKDFARAEPAQGIHRTWVNTREVMLHHEGKWYKLDWGGDFDWKKVPPEELSGADVQQIQDRYGRNLNSFVSWVYIKKGELVLQRLQEATLTSP